MKRARALFLFLAVAAAFCVGQEIWIIYWGPDAYIDIYVGRGGVKSVGGCFQVSQPTQTFSASDEAVYMVAEIHIPSWANKDTYKAVVEWYAPPNGSVLYRRETVSGLKRGYTWCIWRSLPIRNTEVAEKAGVWNVRVDVPGLISQLLAFRIAEAEPTRPTAVKCPRPPEGAGWRDVVALARRAVVFIEGPTNKFDEQGNRLYSHGSGVIISPDGYVLTAAHVVEDITGPIHVLVEEQEWYEAVLVKKHPKWDPKSEDWSADVALLKIKGVSGLYCLPLGDSDSVLPEDEIRILGYPRAGELGLGLVLATGKVLGLRRLEGFSLLEFEASPFDKGHSGGPIINARGEVIGLAMGVAIYEELGVRHQLGVAINTARILLPTGISEARTWFFTFAEIVGNLA